MTNEADRLAPARRGSTTIVLRGNGTTCRVRPWPFTTDTAHLILVHQPHLPSLDDLGRWLDRLAQLGYRTVRTGALGPLASERFGRAGFTCAQELALLEHTSPASAPAPALPTTRLLAGQRRTASVVDRAAFASGWQLDAAAIGEVCHATPRNRARAAGDDEGTWAYAVSGRDARQGFLQRLAVHPSRQRHGYGRALVHDSLRWLARWNVQRVLVNTPTDNAPAIELYHRTGFRTLPDRLQVLDRSIA